MDNKELKSIMNHAEERMYDYMTSEGRMPALALLVNEQGLILLPLPTKTDAELKAKAAILRQTTRETNAEAVVYITEASLKTERKARKQHCIIIAGASQGEKLIRTLPFTRKGKDIFFQQENPETTATTISFRHPVIDTM